MVSVLASLGVHSEVRIASPDNSQDIYMCDMTWGMLETTYPGYFQTSGAVQRMNKMDHSKTV